MVRLLPFLDYFIVYKQLTSFNPTMVRLLLDHYLDGLRVGNRFNPTMVRLLQSFPASEVSKEDCFNPTMVRLLHGDGTQERSTTDSFNPTMVRLLLADRRAIWLYHIMFQSHNGAIAAQRVVNENRF